nr:RbsD / FucU transport protein family [Raoultella sp. NCTC 9187]
MIKSDIIHPDLLQALALCGHKANILIADANYSILTNSAAQARIVYLNFSPRLNWQRDDPAKSSWLY